MQYLDLIALIEKTAPLSIAAPWDHSGVQVAAERTRITHLAVCLDPTPSAIAAALAIGADMVLSHHPLIMEPRFLDASSDYTRVVRLLMRSDVSLYAAHTSLDANPEGPVNWLARTLGLVNCIVIEPTATLTRPDGSSQVCGFGTVGTLPVSLSAEALRQILSPYLEGSCARLVGTLPPCINRLAICPGSGASLGAEAADLEAQVLITGDIKYHGALERALPLLDVGHFSLEYEMMRLFALHLKKTLPQLAVTFLPAHDPLRPFFPTPHFVEEETE